MKHEPEPYSFEIDHEAIARERRGNAAARDKHERRLRQFAAEPTAPPGRLTTDAAGILYEEPREQAEIWSPSPALADAAIVPTRTFRVLPDGLGPEDTCAVIDSALPPRPPVDRHDGWTPERRSAFLEELASTASVTEAARFVAMSRQSARRLYNRDASFRRGWHAALRRARVVLVETAFERATRGTQMPVWNHEGHLIGYRERHHDGLLIALLHMSGPGALDVVEGDEWSDEDGDAAPLLAWPIPPK